MELGAMVLAPRNFEGIFQLTSYYCLLYGYFFIYPVEIAKKKYQNSVIIFPNDVITTLYLAKILLLLITTWLCLLSRSYIRVHAHPGKPGKCCKIIQQL